jgi:hypothetical protein
LKFLTGIIQTDDRFIFFKDQRIFLSGIFLSDLYFESSNLESKRFPSNLLKDIEDSGGNTVEFVLHGGHITKLKFDSQGLVTDEVTETLITDLLTLLNEAANHNIMVIIRIWNMYNLERFSNLFENDSVLNSYFDNVLIHILNATSDHEALVAWSIIDSPERLIKWKTKNDVECFDTQKFSFADESFYANAILMERVLRFINLHSSLIHTHTKKLVTLNVWHYEINSNCADCFNYFKDECLQNAGTKMNGILDFYSIRRTSSESCLISNKRATDLRVDKPIVINYCMMYRFLNKKDGEIYKQAHDELYAGIMGYYSNREEEIDKIMKEMRALAATEVKSHLKISIQN